MLRRHERYHVISRAGVHPNIIVKLCGRDREANGLNFTQDKQTSAGCVNRFARALLTAALAVAALHAIVGTYRGGTNRAVGARK